MSKEKPASRQKKAAKTSAAKTRDRKTAGELLEKKLTHSYKHIAELHPEDVAPAMEFAEGYKLFMDQSKTERECVKTVTAMAVHQGYKAFDASGTYAAGDRVYYVNRLKNIFLVTFGKKPVSEGVRFNIAHIDSPRLDLKPHPLYEKSEIAYLKTHYYGGIRKYQWGTIPLSMHGVAVLSDGQTVEISYGENPDEPKFMISDLLPHISIEQNKRPLSEGLKGEELNIIIGNLPVEDDSVKERYKLMALSILNEKYGMKEVDFARAEIEFVPAAHASDIGLDRSMVGAYGQDDRVCAYAAVRAAFDVRDPAYTTVTLLTDKEEVGSEGPTGMASRTLHHFMQDIADIYGVKVREIYENSICLSSDVNSAYDPTFPDVFDPQNSSYMGRGPVLTKYTGSRGKSGSNDASAETMARVIDMMERENVVWQIGEIGKVDMGGGGTIALFVGDLCVDTVDLGVPVIAMHAPFELVSKLDLYHTFKAFRAFYR